MSLKPGQNLGHYVILEQIGKGGMATVSTRPAVNADISAAPVPTAAWA